MAAAPVFPKAQAAFTLANENFARAITTDKIEHEPEITRAEPVITQRRRVTAGSCCEPKNWTAGRLGGPAALSGCRTEYRTDHRTDMIVHYIIDDLYKRATDILHQGVLRREGDYIGKP